MANVVVDIQEGGARITTDRGWELRRIVMVHDVTTGMGYAKIRTAYEADGVPKIGNEHPDRIGCKLHEIQPEIIDNTTIKFTAIYWDTYSSWTPIPPPSNSCIQTGASVSQDETFIDRNGNGIYVPYKLKKYPMVASMLIPSATMTITKEENFDPSSKADLFVGKVNDAGWSLKPDAEKGRWMCMSITGISYNGGETYINTYTFQSRRSPNEYFGFVDAEGWSAYVYYPDADTGRLPEDCLDDDGKIIDGVWCWNVAQVINFNLLGLP